MVKFDRKKKIRTPHPGSPDTKVDASIHQGRDSSIVAGNMYQKATFIVLFYWYTIIIKGYEFLTLDRPLSYSSIEYIESNH